MQKLFIQSLQLVFLALMLSGGCGIDPINVPDAESNDRFEGDTAAPSEGSDAGTDAATDAEDTGTPTETGTSDEAGGDTGDTGTDTDSGTGDNLNPTDAPEIRPRKVFHAADRSLIVGVENATISADSITVRDAATENPLTQSEVAFTGAFTAQLETVLPDLITIEASSASGSIGTADVELCDGGVNVYEFGNLITQAFANDTFTATRSGNLVELIADSGLLPRGLKVVVGNLDNDHASALAVAQDGGVELTVSAESGDDLAIFAVEGNCNGGGEPLIIEAP